MFAYYTPADDWVCPDCAAARYGGEYILMLADDPDDEDREGCVRFDPPTALAWADMRYLHCADCGRLLAAAA